MPRIVVLDGHTLNPGDLAWEPLARLGELTVFERTPPELVLERALGAEILITNKTRLDAALFARLTELVGVGVLATGFDQVDAHAAREHGVVVCNVPAYSTASVAQHSLALLLELASHVGLHAAAVAAGEWSSSPDFSFWKQPIRELEGQTFGIVGLGAIGKRVATLASALGMHVIATPSRRLPSPAPGVTVRELGALLREADVVSLHCPLTDETRRLIRRERLLTMKSGALLINTARGAIVDVAALIAALRAGTIAGAGIDVLPVEPPRDDDAIAVAYRARHDPMFGDRLILTPHAAWSSPESVTDARRLAVETAMLYLREGKLRNLVNVPSSAGLRGVA